VAEKVLKCSEGLMESDDAIPSLSGGYNVSETAVASILGSSFGTFVTETADIDSSNDPLGAKWPIW
jgi:hypothetical protein